MDDNGAAEDTLGTDQLDELIGDGALGIALTIGLEVAQVTNVALRVRGGTVGLAVGVDCFCQPDSYNRCLYSCLVWYRLTVRAGGSAAVGVVTEGVDVHATLGVGIVAGDVPADGGLGTLRGLLKGDGAGDLGVSAKDGNYSKGTLATWPQGSFMSSVTTWHSLWPSDSECKLFPRRRAERGLHSSHTLHVTP